MSNNPKAVCQEFLTQINIERAQCSQLHLRLEWCQVGRSRALDILPLPRGQTPHQGCLSMKFKAAFSDQGLGSLCKGEPAHCLHAPVHLCCRETTVCFILRVSAGLLPALDKFGKTCQLLLGPQDVHFVQTSQDTDGVRITACWSTVRIECFIITVLCELKTIVLPALPTGSLVPATHVHACFRC